MSKTKKQRERKKRNRRMNHRKEERKKEFREAIYKLPLNQLIDGGGCASRGHEQSEPHGCPYQSDVNDNEDFLCTCCPECRQQCLMDI
jgi:hypothetical protein